LSFIGGLFETDKSGVSEQFGVSQRFPKLVVAALQDAESSVVVSALETLRHISSSSQAWLSIAKIPETWSGFNTERELLDSDSTEFSFVVVNLLTHEDSFVTRAAVSLLRTWLIHSHTKSTIMALIWNQAYRFRKTLPLVLHGSDWETQVSTIRFLQEVGFSMGVLPFLALDGHDLLLEMTKDYEERLIRKNAVEVLQLLSKVITKTRKDEIPNNFWDKLEHFQHILESQHLASSVEDDLYSTDEEEDLVLIYQNSARNDEDMDCY